MKCFAVLLIALCIIEEGRGQVSSLNAISLIASQVDFLEDMCFNRTNDEAVYEQLRMSVEDCRTTIFNGTQVEFTYDALLATEPKEFYEFYMSQCNDERSIQTRSECNGKLQSELRQCLNATEIEAFNKIEDIAARVFKVICDLDQEKMTHFFSEKGQECISDNVISIGYCFLRALPEKKEDRQNFLFNLVDGKECKIIEDTQECMMVGLEMCDEPFISQIFKLFFDIFKSEFNCRNLIESDPLVTSASGLFSIVKVSSTLLMSIFMMQFSTKTLLQGMGKVS